MRSHHKPFARVRSLWPLFTAFFLVAVWLTAPVLAWAAEPPALREATGAEKARRAKLIAGAKKEGKLVFRTHSMSPDVWIKASKVFKEYYGLQDAQLSHALMRTGPLMARTKKEIQAGIQGADIIHLGCPAACKDLAKKGHLMAYWSPEYAAYDKAVTTLDGAAAAYPPYYISAMISYFGIAYNRQMTGRDLKSWDDLLDPKFKGKIIMQDAGKSSTTSYSYAGFRKIVPLSFWKKLAKQQKPTVILSNRQVLNRLLAKEFAIGIFITSRLVYREHKRGNTHIKVLHPGGRNVAVGYHMMILKNAPHPNMAKLWVDFFHSKKGQEIIEPMMGYAPARDDVKLPAELLELSPPTSKMKLIPIDWKNVDVKFINKVKAEHRSIFSGGKKASRGMR